MCFLSVFHTISRKSMQLGSPDLTYKFSTMSPEIQRSKVKGHNVSVRLQTERSILPLLLLRTLATLSLPCRNAHAPRTSFPASACAGFSPAWVICTLVSAGFFYLIMWKVFSKTSHALYCKCMSLLFAVVFFAKRQCWECRPLSQTCEYSSFWLFCSATVLLPTGKNAEVPLQRRCNEWYSRGFLEYCDVGRRCA